MRRSTSSRSQVVRVSQVKHLKELQQENNFLKLLYADLLQKFSAMKGEFTRSAWPC